MLQVLTLVAKPKILWLGDGGIPANLAQAARERCDLTCCTTQTVSADLLSQADLAVVSPNGSSNDAAALEALIDQIDESHAVGVFLLPPEAEAVWRRVHNGRTAVLWIREDAGPAEIAAKLEAAGELQPAIRNLKSALMAHRDEDRQLEMVAEEMKLASRLQRDFLPRTLPEVGPARFSVLFQPASFVSGDIYDVVRLDETHVGFYVADAVGHGMPAALLTMFIKKALQTKRIVENTYQIVPPAESMAELNSSICEQNLSSCQFCTAVYCVLDTANRSLVYARAGHPEPILLRADGRVEPLLASGSLLGVFPEATFDAAEVQLSPGDRLVLYTDGAEAYARGEEADGHEELLKFIATLQGLDRAEMQKRLDGWVERVRRISREDDDITILVLDV